MSELLMPDERTLATILHEMADYGHHDPLSGPRCMQCEYNASIMRAEARRIQDQRERLASSETDIRVRSTQHWQEVIQNLAIAWGSEGEPGLMAAPQVDSIGE